MLLSNSPSQLVLAFGANAASSYINTIPVPSQISTKPGAASYTDGFPPLTMTAATSGGVPISGPDLNGILNASSAIDVWMSAGASFAYNATFSTAIGGYPKGARLIMASGLGYWISTVDSNVSDPDTGGAGWVAQVFGSNRVSSVYQSTQYTLPIGTNKLTFNTVEFDPASMWNATDGYFIAPWAGVYRLSGSVMLETPGGQMLGTSVWKNGAEWKTCLEFPQVSDQNLSLNFDAALLLNAGDYVYPALMVGASTVTVGGDTSNQIYVYAQLEFIS